MATNYSMLSNIASGIREGMTAYQTAKAQERQEKMTGLIHGYTVNPETGEYELTPEMKQQKELSMKKTSAELAESDPNSDISKNTQAWAKQNGLIGTEGMSASQIKGLIPILTAKEKNKGTIEAADIRSKVSGNLGNIRSDEQSARAVSRIHDDSDIKAMTNQGRNIDKGMDLISDPSKPPSITTMHEIAQDFAQALSGKGVASDYKLKSISTPTLQEKIKQLEGFMQSNPNQPAPPEVVAFWKDMGERLRGAYDRNIESRAQGKLTGLDTAYKNNRNAFTAAKEAADMYKGGNWRKLGGDESAQAPAMQAAPSATVKVLDPKGNVRLIPKDQLQDALKAGGKLAE